MDIGEVQFGFKRGMGTREALFRLKILAEKCKDQQKGIYICLRDYEKVPDRVNHVQFL